MPNFISPTKIRKRGFGALQICVSLVLKPIASPSTLHFWFCILSIITGAKLFEATLISFLLLHYGFLNDIPAFTSILQKITCYIQHITCFSSTKRSHTTSTFCVVSHVTKKNNNHEKHTSILQCSRSIWYITIFERVSFSHLHSVLLYLLYQISSSSWLLSTFFLHLLLIWLFLHGIHLPGILQDQQFHFLYILSTHECI